MYSPDFRHSRHSPRLLLEWWDGTRGRREMPRRDELDPVDLRHILPDLMLVGVAPGERPESFFFTYRLVGTRIDQGLGASITGKLLEPAPLGNEYDDVYRHYRHAVRERRPHACRQRLLIGGARHVDYECVAAPLSGPDGQTVVALVAAIDVIASYMIVDGPPPHAPQAPKPGTGGCLPPLLGETKSRSDGII